METTVVDSGRKRGSYRAITGGVSYRRTQVVMESPVLISYMALDEDEEIGSSEKNSSLGEKHSDRRKCSYTNTCRGRHDIFVRWNASLHGQRRT